MAYCFLPTHLIVYIMPVIIPTVCVIPRNVFFFRFVLAQNVFIFTDNHALNNDVMCIFSFVFSSFHFVFLQVFEFD